MLEKTGIGLRSLHIDHVLARKPGAGFLEAHAENYFRIGGVPFNQLMKCQEIYPISLHGVGLSLGSAEGISREHLQKFKTLVDIVKPRLVSEHMSWSGTGGTHVPDLLPLPLTEEALDIICGNIDRMQNELGREILMENPSSYITPAGDMSEPQFMSEMTQRTGCGLLLDVNNIYVSAHHQGFNAEDYLAGLPAKAVGEIHLAGYQDNNGVLIDAHNNPVQEPVWKLYEAALGYFGDVPSLIEWDNDLPSLVTLLAEAKKADALRARMKEKCHDCVA